MATTKYTSTLTLAAVEQCALLTEEQKKTMLQILNADPQVLRDFKEDYELAPNPTTIAQFYKLVIANKASVEDPHEWNPLYSTKLRTLTGLNTPWEQWVALGLMVGGPYQAFRTAVRHRYIARWLEHKDTLARDLAAMTDKEEALAKANITRFKYVGRAKVVGVLLSPLFFLTWRMVVRSGKVQMQLN